MKTLLLLLCCALLPHCMRAQSSDLPVIITQPQSQFVLPGDTVTVSVTATNPNWVTLTTNSWGSSDATTNLLSTGQNSGVLVIDFDFYAIPDTLSVYYDGSLIFDSGLQSGSGRFTVNYGPGISTNVEIVLNEGGNSDPNTAWDYSATVSGALIFQWLKNGNEILSATNFSYSITNVQLFDA